LIILVVAEDLEENIGSTFFNTGAMRGLDGSLSTQDCVDEPIALNAASLPVLKMVLQYFFEIFRDDKNYQSKRSKKFDANAPKDQIL